MYIDNARTKTTPCAKTAKVSESRCVATFLCWRRRTMMWGAPDKSAGSFHEVLVSGIELKVPRKYPNSTLGECKFRYTAFTGAACRPFQVLLQPRDSIGMAHLTCTLLARLPGVAISRPAVYAVAMCLSVCLSVTGRFVSKRPHESSWVFGTEASFDLSHLAG